MTSQLLKTMSETLIELQKEMRDLKQNNKGWKQGGAPQPFPFRCYAFDEVGNRAFDCPTYPNFQYNYQHPRYQNKPKTRYTNQNYEKLDLTLGKVAVHKLSPDAGMFLKAKVNGIITDLLIDTGATVTVISTKMFQKMLNMPNLIPTERDIITANGDSLHMSGKTELEIETDKFKNTNTAIVADINVDCILGLDFLRTQEAYMNISKGTLTIKGHEVRFYVQGHIGCYRVAISETVNIPPRSEIVVNGAITDEVPDLFEVGLVEPTDDYNRTEAKIQTLYGGTIIAKVIPVDKISEPNFNLNQTSETPVPLHLTDLYNETVQDLTKVEATKVRELLQKFSHIFAKHDADFGRTDIVKHSIDVQNAKPTREPPRRVPYNLQGEYHQAINDMIDKNVIEPSTSPWASGVVLVQKKNGLTRFCLDYRRLKKISTKDGYPLPRIDDSLNQLSGAKWFSTINMCSGYWQVEVEANDRPKTAFATRKGLFQFQNPEGQMARWLEVLFSFDMEIQHRAGRKHNNADPLSRLPCKPCTNCGNQDDDANIICLISGKETSHGDVEDN
ncbi:unnamed protein product [Mytilus coruscus]|uniref:Peptidase A2 domain-containing protein n=1 Tax=Mytilus coruscus TaxID=42192 RepID=A0A6J8DVZ7_MYTCO|nr:unnamed protein product [Mytilus coruscus]